MEVNNEQPNETKKVHVYNSINPFIEGVIEHISESRYRKAVGINFQQVLNDDTGELNKQKILILGEQKKVDEQQYYKMYYGSIQKFFNLSSKTVELFEYVMQNIKYGSDRVCVSYDTIKEARNMSKSSFYRAIIQLLDSQLLAKADTEGCYYINPAIAFKGDRIMLVTEYIMNKTASKLP